MQTKRVERLLKIIQVLQSGRPTSVEELAQTAGVDKRTVFRDLKLLGRSGIQYVYDRQAKCYTGHSLNLLPPVSLDHSEALALLLATRKFLDSDYIPDRKTAASAAMKIEGMLPQVIQDYCGPLLERMGIQPAALSDPAPILETFELLQNSMAQRRRIRVRYDSYYKKRTIEDVLDPYRLMHINRGWYVIAYSEQEKKPLTFKIERMVQIDMLEERYHIESGFSLEKYFGNAWVMIKGDKEYHVKIRFLPLVAGNVDEVCWHKTQVTRHDPDGSLIFEADVDGFTEIGWWVLGYGDQAQVIAPSELRRFVADHARRMADHYGDVETPSE